MHEPKFPHRRNDDGTWDSICPLCFVDSATAGCEDDLTELEKRHVRGHCSRAERNQSAGRRGA